MLIRGNCRRCLELISVTDLERDDQFFSGTHRPQENREAFDRLVLECFSFNKAMCFLGNAHPGFFLGKYHDPFLH